MRRFLHLLQSAALTGAAAAVLSGCSGGGGPAKTETVETGYKGIARSQPFLAAERLLEESGLSVQHIHSASKLPTYGEVLILSAGAAESSVTTRRVLDWVESRGGHVIFLAEQYESWRDDWEMGFGDLAELFRDHKPGPLLRALNIETTTSPKTSGEVEIADREFTYEMRNRLAFKIGKRRPDVISGSRDEAWICSFEQGRGRVTLIASAHPFRNRFIDREDHADLLLEIVQLGDAYKDSYRYGSNEVFFFLTGSDSFLSMVWSRFWMPLSALLALVVLLLWKAIPRFGPMRRAPGENVRQFSEHLKMSGQFLWRHGQSGELLEAVRRSILQKIKSRHASLNPHDEEDLLPKLAEMSRVPLAKVREAWRTAHLPDSTRMIHHIRHLQAINNAL
jgi:hypothetical protein